MNPIIEQILNVEGGYVSHPADKGGPTCWGITEATAKAHGYQGDMRLLPREEAYRILEESYWIAPGYSRINELSPAIALELCDAGVNVGTSHPSSWLQRWLNVFNLQESKYPRLSVDGMLGNQTFDALAAYLKWRGKEGEAVLLCGLNASQADYYLLIAEKHPDNEAFIYGWIKNRVLTHAE